MTDTPTSTHESSSADPGSRPATGGPLARLPRWVPAAVAAVLLVAAAVVAGTSGWILLAAATLVLGWLVALTWPHTGSNGRLFQAAVILAAYALVLVRLLPRG